MEYKILLAIIMITATANVTIGLGAEAAIEVFAKDPDDMTSKERYDSGFDHGCSDSHIWDASERYINQKEKGFSYHTSDFNQGYRDGFEECGYDGGVLSYPNGVTNIEEESNQQEQNQAAYTHQNGSCGVVLIGDCNVGQSSKNNFAANAEN